MRTGRATAETGKKAAAAVSRAAAETVKQAAAGSGKVVAAATEAAAATAEAAGAATEAAAATAEAAGAAAEVAGAATEVAAAAAEWSAGPLVKADLTGPGLRRRRSGRGFRYLAADGSALTDAEAVARIKALVIPPAWEDVWISPESLGHIQAVGTDAAGRRQYMYHQLWREQRDQAKFDRVMEFGRALPQLRAVVERQLQGTGLTRDRVLATAVRLIDLGFFRSGADEYAAENGTYGLATIRREHVTCGKCELTFEYIGKSGKHREQAVADAAVCSVVRSLKRRRSGLEWEDLLVYRSGTRWHNVSAGDINDYLRETTGGEFTAKDFRTWHATVLAAVGLAVSVPAAKGSPAARKRAVARVVQEVAGYLGNTPAVARASYIDPRIIALYAQGVTIASVLPDLGQGQEFGDVATKGAAERAVLRLLTGDAHRLPLTRQRPGKAAGMAELVPATITGVVRETGDGPGRRERFSVELAAGAGGDARRVRIGIGDAEAAALAFSLQGQEFPRPMTYQFMASLVEAAGSAVRAVRVTGQRDGIFYAQVMLRGGATVDARPSDALNLAAVTRVPVYVAAELLGAGVSPGG